MTIYTFILNSLAYGIYIKNEDIEVDLEYMLVGLGENFSFDKATFINIMIVITVLSFGWLHRSE